LLHGFREEKCEMKILGVSFGTKDGANDSMCKEALLAAQEEGAEVSFIHMYDWEIKYCTGCVACSRALTMGKGNLCVLKDDFDAFRDIMLDADGVLFVSPVFEQGTSGLVHSICDRMGPRIDRGLNFMADMLAKEGKGVPVDQRLLQDKVMSFIGIGGSDWQLRVQCDHAMVALSPGWKIIDNERFCWSKQIIMDDEKVARVREIGKNLAKAAGDIANAKYMGAPGVCPHCNNNEFTLVPGTTKAACCVCGIEGDFVIEDGKTKFVFGEEWLVRAHDTLSGKKLHGDDILEMETKNLENRKTDEYKRRVQRYKDAFTPLMPPPRG